MASNVTSKKNANSLFGKWTHEGSFVPLFIKLQNLNPDEPKENPPLKTLSKEDLKASVITEISCLLNTRVRLPMHTLESLSQTEAAQGFPELYGIPDFFSFDASNQGTWAYYAGFIKNAIRVYEPRLANVSVVLKRFIASSQTLEVSISGELLMNETREPFSFSLSLTKTST